MSGQFLIGAFFWQVIKKVLQSQKKIKGLIKVVNS